MAPKRPIDLTLAEEIRESTRQHNLAQYERLRAGAGRWLVQIQQDRRLRKAIDLLGENYHAIKDADREYRLQWLQAKDAGEGAGPEPEAYAPDVQRLINGDPLNEDLTWSDD
jgi:hypothetical protein